MKLSGKHLLPNDIKVMEILSEYGNVSKADAEQYGMATTTFHDHVKKLVEFGMVEEIPVKTNPTGKGRPKIYYKLVKKNG